MTTFDRIQELAKKRDKNLKQVSLELGYSKNYLYTLQSREPAADKLKAIADYFGVTTDYLLGRTDTPEFTRKDERDVQKILDNLLDGLSDKHSLAYLKNGGEEIDEEDAELIYNALEKAARRAKILAKEKYTPNKYKKTDKE